MTWEGGLASHGGAIGVLLAIWWYVHKYGRKYGFGYIQLIDRLVIPICFAGMMIRLGNLMNSEIYGVQTDLPWGFIFLRDPMGDGLPHHPTQLYEAGQAAHRHHLRYLPDSALRHEVPDRIHQGGPGGLRAGHDPEHGPVAERAVHHRRYSAPRVELH